MALLSIIRTVCQRIGLPAPSVVIGNNDQQVAQLLALLNEEGEDLARRYTWQALCKEATFSTVAAETQGTVESIAPGLKYIINDTIWNRSLRRPVYGPKTPQQWQQYKAAFMQGPFNHFRIRNGLILFVPVPVAGQNCYFEYVSDQWVQSASGSAWRSTFAADDDTSLLDENLLILGTIWRWKAAKGFDSSVDYDKYDDRVLDAMGRDGGKDWINMNGTRWDILPGVVVPSGSWNL